MLSYKLQVREYYETLGMRYLDLYLRDSVLGYLKAAEALRTRGLRILDIGCGVGVGAGLLSGSAAQYVCLDIACGVLRYANSLPNADIVCADAALLPIRPGSIDYALLINVVNAETDGEAILREALSLGARVYAESPRALDNELIRHLIPRVGFNTTD
ncbi:class I SAM-dependent methyltransferase [Vulcanisaeta sp. JCM 14467]|uniref:class I SAM-dependent methyltransferase n=1 Tax=Vulcanisaeta sp. JCM 14467 TaxID=1295370 RepID=UPI0006D08987|nr:methyltransferase domain-containing protein [Vulcanisaeta sp. JCM 14467]